MDLHDYSYVFSACKDNTNLITNNLKIKTIMQTSKTKDKTKNASVKTAQKPSDIPDTIQERRRFIKNYLQQYQDKSFYCRALDYKVKVIDKSIDETAYHGALSKQATKLAIHLPQIIREASILELHLPPKIGRQRKVMKFKEIANLLAVIPRIGKAKLTVGYVENGECIEYAITEYEAIK